MVGGIATPAAREDAIYSLSRSGVLAYVAARERPGYTLQWVDRTGAVSAAIETVRAYESPRLSPTGDRVALSILDVRPARYLMVA